MFRVKKALNHNTLIAISMDNNQEYLLIGKGIGFGKKVSERFEITEPFEFKKESFTYRISLYLIHCKCTTKTELSGW